ncbi:hypothetical protein TraAM80_01603 [Trypanosoma rangeli]|uniref:BSD domain-containing protein n=1 Tax=Trypanosoma rangeli TaxID=5698 RepID=A0A3R7LAJ1_TRYRA|nr:uncharacterized protein TraAM80_01603 [Trypanosoma rangeli]RNF10430.1 hypothetical protein TraAM80_01603 [Trypanosoma rangeli]|eukprot:RNF10430.1 hypothetical protein TraAM80_01603 [Trypanosoma rangeli]
MTSVELVSNPSNELSTHRWTIGGLRHLNRKNKLSSLPFWTPNHVTKKHQFRCVLIRGMVAKDQETDDYVGLILELIPPPEGDDVAYPGGCSITARVVNRVHDQRTHDIVQTQTVAFVPEQLQMSFPELIPPTTLDSPEFVEGEDMALFLEVTIETGVNVAVEWANKTVSKFWGTVYESVNQMVRKVSKAYSDTREEYGMQKEEEALSVPWDNVPENWVGREKEWRHLISEQIVEDEGTFRYGPNRGFSKDEQALLLQCGLNQRLITNAQAQFDYDRDVHEGLLALPGMRQQRYHLVPGKIKEKVFWANYFSKVVALAQCKNDEQVRMLLTVLNAPPAVKARDMSSFRAVDERTVLEHVKAAQETADMLVEYLTDDAPYGEILVEAAATACKGQVKQLDGYFKRVDLSEETLRMTGAVLKRLRERLNAYAEWKEQHAASLSVLKETEDDAHASQDVTAEETVNNSEASVSIMGGAKGEYAAVDAGESHATSTNPTTKAGDSTWGSMDFPLMPWEEEEVAEAHKREEDAGGKHKKEM